MKSGNNLTSAMDSSKHAEFNYMFDENMEEILMQRNSNISSKNKLMENSRVGPIYDKKLNHMKYRYKKEKGTFK